MRERFLCLCANVRGGLDTMRACYVYRPDQRRAGYGHVEVPAWCWLLRVYVCGPAYGFEQFWFCWAWHEWDWPEWPGRVATAFHYWIEDRLERFDRPMRWNAPDSGIPGEIGFWSESTGTHERSPTRMFVSTVPTTVTSGSATWTHIEWGSA